MSNNITDKLSKVFTPDQLVRCGLDNAKTYREVAVGFGTWFRSWAHNPFGSNDRYNQRLDDRKVNAYVEAFCSNSDEVSNRDQLLERLCPKELSDKITALKGRKEELGMSNNMMAVLVQLNYNEDSLISIVKIYNEINETYNSDQLFTGLQEKINCELSFTSLIMREIVNEFGKVEVEKVASNVFSKITSKYLELVNESREYSDCASRTKDLLAVMKREFVFETELFTLQAILSLFSTALMFSLSQWLGFITFGASLFAVLATLPCTVALMESAWKQLASYGDHEGPKDWNEARTNILNHMRGSWNKVVESDKSFHPVVSAFLGTCVIMTTWGSLAFVGLDFFALRYVALDTYLNIQSSLITGKDYDMSVRDVFAAAVSGFARGLIKASQMFLFFGDSSGIARAYCDGIATYICSVLGYIIYQMNTQFLTPEKLQEYKWTVAKWNEQTAYAWNTMNKKIDELNKWLDYNHEKKLV